MFFFFFFTHVCFMAKKWLIVKTSVKMARTKGNICIQRAQKNGSFSKKHRRKGENYTIQKTFLTSIGVANVGNAGRPFLLNGSRTYIVFLETSEIQMLIQTPNFSPIIT